jgi:hypothetical protein
MPDDMDDAHKSEAFFISDLQKQKKSKSDERSSIRKEEENEASVARPKASFSEGRGLSNKDYLMAASIAQQSSTAGSNVGIDHCSSLMPTVEDIVGVAF